MDYQVESDFVRLENGNITITESKGDFNPLCGTYNLIIGRTFSIITTPMENGATYELIIEGCENVGGSMISASRITSRTQMEIKIETTQ